jgi:tetratricopeptide (TPR) repeat protein
MSAGRLDAAEETFRWAIAREPNAAAFQIDLGHVLERAGRVGEAIEAAIRGVELDPSNARGHAYLAHLFFSQQQWNKSEDGYRRAAALAPEEAHWQVQLIRCLIAQDRTDDARVIADVAIHLDPNNALLRTYSTEWPSERVVGE